MVETFRELVLRTRSFRRFDASHPVGRDTLVKLVDLARHTASAANRQPLRYFLSADPATNDTIFPCLAWAGYLPDWVGPAPAERPTAYITLCIDTSITQEWWCDDGIAAQTILLGAAERGLGGCLIGAIRKDELRGVLSIPEHLKIRLVIALGKPAETVVIEDLPPGGDVRYWRDGNEVHHVPKRRLDELIVG